MVILSSGSDFKIDRKKERILEILVKLSILSLEYPDDLYGSAYYLFGVPPPAAYLPIEQTLMKKNNCQIIFVFGEKDWMERLGAYRLSIFDPNIYKYFTVKNAGHSFAMENPKELCAIIGQYFEE